MSADMKTWQFCFDADENSAVRGVATIALMESEFEREKEEAYWDKQAEEAEQSLLDSEKCEAERFMTMHQEDNMEPSA